MISVLNFVCSETFLVEVVGALLYVVASQVIRQISVKNAWSEFYDLRSCVDAIETCQLVCPLL
jgi:hypothetical protein